MSHEQTLILKLQLSVLGSLWEDGNHVLFNGSSLQLLKHIQQFHPRLITEEYLSENDGESHHF